MLRALAKYLRQINFNLSQTYIENTFARYPNITKGLVNLFYKRFDPQFNLDESLAQPSPLEDVDTTTTSGVEEAQATPAQAPTGEEMYDTKGDSPTVNEMLQEVIEYEDLGEVDDGIREQLNKTHIDEDLIEDILGM